jgi:SAM-dependent methyltransferase
MTAKSEIFKRLALEREFHDEWARTIDLESLDPDRSYGCPTKPEVTYAVNSMGDVRGKRLLDLGAGSGESSVFFAKRGAEVLATDVSPAMCAVVRELARNHGCVHRINVSVVAGEFLPFREACVDLVFGEDVLHHLDLDLALPEIRRVLKEGGKAVFIEPLGHNPFLNLFRSLSPETRTESERPLLTKDLEKIGRFFTRSRHREFHLLTLLLYLWFYVGERADPNKQRYWKKIIYEAEKYRKPFELLYTLDKTVLRAIPYFKRHCRMTVIECWK